MGSLLVHCGGNRTQLPKPLHSTVGIPVSGFTSRELPGQRWTTPGQTLHTHAHRHTLREAHLSHATANTNVLCIASSLLPRGTDAGQAA